MPSVNTTLGMSKKNPVKKFMDKIHKPKTHKDKTKYNRNKEKIKMTVEKETDKKEYVVLGKETYYYKTYVQANSEKEAREIATQNHTKADIHEDESVQVCLIDEGGFYKAEYSYPLGERNER